MTYLGTQVKDPPLTRFPQPGDDWFSNRAQRAADNEKLYRNDFSPLLAGRIKAARNGLLQVVNDNEFVTTNWFKAITNFKVDAITSERPPISSSNQARADFAEANAETLFNLIGQGLRNRSWGGYWVVASGGNRLRAIPAGAYRPIVNEFDADRTEAHLLAYAYNTGSATLPPNRLRVVEIFGGRSEVKVYSLNGTKLGALLESGPGDISELYVFGDDGDDDYSGIYSLAGWGMVLQTLMGQGLVRHFIPALAGPVGWIQELESKTREQIERQVAQGLTVGLEPDDAPLEFPTFDINVRDALDALQWYADKVYMTTGVSPVVFGLEGRGNSGVSLDRLMFNALARVRTDRRHIETVLPALLDDLGAPSGDTTVTWPADPFATVAERAAAIRSDLEAGIIEVAEARAARGYGEAAPADSQLERRGGIRGVVDRVLGR